jgi:hypothetical protein
MVWSKLIFVWWTCQLLLLLLLLLVVEVTHSYLFSAPLQVCPPHRAPSSFACPPARRRCGSDHHGGGSHHHDAAAADDDDDGNHIVPPRVSPSLPLPSALPPSVIVPMQRRNVLWQLGITGMSSSSLGMMMFDTKSAMAAVSENDTTNNNSSDDTDDDDDDTTTMVTQLFNTDGSLKDTGTVVAASVRPVTLSLEEEEVVVARSSSSLWVDGKRLSSDTTTTTTTTTNSRKVIGNNRRSSIVIRYDLPTKWDSTNYLDTTTQERACTHISVYRVPYHSTPTNHGTASSSSSTSSSSIAVSDIIRALPEDSAVGAVLRRADSMSGRIRRVVVVPQDTNDDSDSAILPPPMSYSELDFAVAPTTCSGGEAEDLRLGFCPYDRILLVSAIVVAADTTTTTQTTVPPPPAENDINDDGSFLYLLIVESTRAEWQRANAELRRVRSSFTVVVHSSE